MEPTFLPNTQPHDLISACRVMVDAAERMRMDWAEMPPDGPERRTLWRDVHTAADWLREILERIEDGVVV